MKRLLLAFIFAILLVSSVGFVSAIVPVKQNATQDDSCTTTTKVLYDTISLRTDHNQYAFARFNSARSGMVGFKELTFAYDNNTLPQVIQPILAHQLVTSTNRGRIYPTENTWAKISDWVIVNQGGAGTALEVPELRINSAIEGSVTFQDVITGESQSVTLTNTTGTNGYYQKSGVNFFGGTGYNIRMTPDGQQVSITWGQGSSPGNAGTFTTVAPDIQLANGSSIVLTTVKTAWDQYGINCSKASSPWNYSFSENDLNPAVLAINASSKIEDDKNIFAAQKICIPITSNSLYLPMNFDHARAAFATGNIGCVYDNNYLVTCGDSAGNKVTLDSSPAVQGGTVVNITLVRRVSETNCTNALNATTVSNMTYRLCSVNNTCVQVLGKGTSSCSTDNDCNNQTGPRHLDCRYSGTVGWCAYVSGIGNNTCLNSDNCNHYYSTCTGYTCSAVIGNGNSTCSSDSDCSHLGCLDNRCAKILGAGTNGCTEIGQMCIHPSPPVTCTGFIGWIKRLFGKC